MAVSIQRTPPVDQSPAAPAEVVGTVSQVRYRDAESGFTILVLNSGITIKLEDAEESVHERRAYRFLGRWSEHAKYGRSFQADIWALDQPNYQKAVVEYLVEFAPGIGTRKAEQLWQQYGAEAVTVLRERPDAVAAETGIPVDDCRRAAEKLAELQEGEQAKLNVYRLLTGRGLPRKTAQLALAKWGRRAAEMLQRNPFALVVARFAGCGFRRVDKLYAELGHPPDKLKRQTLAAWDALRRGANGSTWVLADEVEDELRKTVGPDATPARAVALGVRAGLASQARSMRLGRRVGGVGFLEHETYAGMVGRYVADVWDAVDESTVAGRIREMLAGQARWPDLSADEALSNHQRDEFAKALAKPVGLLLGTPGCLTGDTMIGVNRAGKGGRMPIFRLVARLNGTHQLPGRAWDLSIPTMVARADGGYSRLCRLQDAWESGVKETFELRTAGGRVIRATADHPFLTEAGVFVRLGDLRPGDVVKVDVGQGAGGRRKKLYRDRNTMFHPHQRPGNCGRFRCPEHRLAAEAELNGLSLEEFLHILRTNPQRSAALRFLRPRTVVHHKNRNHAENAAGNLAVLDTQSDHAAEHAELVGNVLSRIGPDRVTSIVLFGEEPTYDIEVADDPRCFLANGFVVHNTGKTYATGRLVRAVLAHAGRHLVAVCAPTGKAAVRITAAVRAAGNDVTATTIHKLLEYRPGGFVRTAKNPLDARFVIVDEASMLDCSLAARLLEACAPDTHLLLVGDPYQLPPVGHGAPLRDFQAAGLPCGLLTEIRRNGGLITAGCARIKDGQAPKFCDRLNLAAGDNLRLVRTRNASEAMDALSGFMIRVKERNLNDPNLPDAIDKTQVLVAANKKSDLSRKAVNVYLQGLLNADGVKAPGLPFRVMDKVICLRNGWYAEVEMVSPASGLIGLNADDYRPKRDAEFDPLQPRKRSESYVANGEIGRCVAVARGAAVFQFDGPMRTVKVGVGSQTEDEEDADGGEQKGLGCAFDLAYAVTCHKAQGSQWPYVVVLADPSAGMVCSREWVYTALSRAERMCLVIGLAETVEKQIRRRTLHVRRTFLKDLLTVEA